MHSVNRRWGFVGHLWQGRFTSPAVQTEGYLLSCGRYLERNPVAAGLVAEPWDYPWSSARAYAMGESDGLLADNRWYTELAPTPAERQEHGRRFLVGDDPREAVVRQEEWAIGDAAFRQRLQQVQGRPARRGRGRPRKSTAMAERFLPQGTDWEEDA